jgi:UDP-N-acetylmuramyl pentapeptide phosphotransferase/UDP-N-acetylglucosamine-1-phosphate transferase
VAPYGAAVAVAGVVGGAFALFYFDLKGRIMLGDAGAAIWGAVLGYLAVASGPGLVWWVAGLAILGLTVVAEFSSISRVIEEVGALRRLDLWGRGGDE